MADTLADRIMAAADQYAEAEKLGVFPALTKRNRDHLAALVAEATSERVCRWVRVVDGYNFGCGPGLGWVAFRRGPFCHECGGRIELVADGQEVTDGQGVTDG